LAYVRIKRVAGGEYYQVVQARRVDGKPRQRVLLHLGHHPTVDHALNAWPHEIGRLRREGREETAGVLKDKLDRLRKFRAEGVV
jgi:hypothetical protein